MKIFYTFFLVAIGGWLAIGPSSDEITIYYASCAGDKGIRPLLHYDKPGKQFSEIYEQYIQDRKKCVLLPLTDRTYKVNIYQSEVYYQSSFGPERLVKCAIMNSANWRCEWPDGSGYKAVIDGVEAIKKDSSSRPFSLRRWQYWYVTLYWFILGKGPTGDWLIPEQKSL